MKKSSTIISKVNRWVTLLVGLVILVSLSRLAFLLSYRGVHASIDSVRYDWVIRFYSVSEGGSFKLLSQSVYFLIGAIFVFCMLLVVLHWYEISYNWRVRYFENIVRAMIVLISFYFLGMGGYIAMKLYPELEKKEAWYKSSYQEDKGESDRYFDFGLRDIAGLSIIHFVFGMSGCGIILWTKSDKKLK